MVFLDNSIYAIGGKYVGITVERFDGREGKWFLLPSRLISARTFYGGTVLNNYIYCTGGCKLYHHKTRVSMVYVLYQTERVDLIYLSKNQELPNSIFNKRFRNLKIVK